MERFARAWAWVVKLGETCLACTVGMGCVMGQTSSTDVLCFAVLYGMYICTHFVDRIWSPGLSRFGIFGKLRKGRAAEKADGIDGQLARKDD